MSNSGKEWLYSEHRAINILLKQTVDIVKDFSEGQVSHIHELVKIGLALSAEKHLERLLEMIVSEARRFTNADGGTLYIRKEKEDLLDFAIVQNDSLNVRMGGTNEKITWPSVSLKNSDGSDNYQNVSAYCALKGEAINIPDVYDAEGFDFQGTKDFDAKTGYRSKSMLVIPMRDHEDEVIGVLQLLNVRDRESGEVVSFPTDEIEIITSLASQAAIAITNMRLIQGLEDLLNAFVKTIADAIDEKSPYTAGHILRVAELTETIAQEINRVDKGIFSDMRFNDDQMAEIRMAAWMHDVGKITTPEYVVDKATKLETIFDRMELVRHRLEIAKRDAEIKHLRAALQSQGGVADIDRQALDADLGKISEQERFLEKVNVGGEFLADDAVETIQDIARMKISISGKERSFLDENEVANLSIRKGTLTGKERDKINNHVTMSIRMLEGLPFPKKLRYVPFYAGMHHEKLDGSGYPRGLSGEDIPVQARMLAVADVFEALTASDRPYKQGKLLSESMKILGFMVKDNHLDGNICDLMVESGMIAEYARKVLNKRQQDGFEWNGKKYTV
ncbi:MAG: GAF domain-containing protein [Proteobacteria bacterium]|nr:GAF domain-containing protein [Pseudomonadota bacterium]MBU1711068.1 GAF domain-containing protein [Pseudomonadota bacterium]